MMGIGEMDLLDGRQDLVGCERCDQAMVLVRYAGQPLAQLCLPVRQGAVSLQQAWEIMAQRHGESLALALAEHRLGWTRQAVAPPSSLPDATVVICTRDRVEDLRRCLEALCPTLPPGTDVLIVDNAPPDDATARLVRDYPVGYVVEPRKGLNVARQRGATLAKGQIVVYTDDDVVVTSDWLRWMLAPFADPEIAAVCGPVLPLELASPAQEKFESYGGFGRGLSPRRFSVQTWTPLAAAHVGAGANMAFRRPVLLRLGLFEALLDSGTPARSGGDTYAMYRLLASGHAAVYQPRAIVRHRHRRSDAELESMLEGYSVGTFVYLLRCLFKHGELSALPIAARYLWDQHVRQLWRGLRGKPDANPLAMTVAEWRGVLRVPGAYLRTCRAERAWRKEAA